MGDKNDERGGAVTTDTLPQSVRSYFDAVDAQDAASAAGCFTSKALVATPSPSAESAARIVRTPAQLQHDLAERGPVRWRHQLRGVYVRGTTSIVDGELVDRHSDEALSRFVVVARTNPEGKIQTFRSFRQGDRSTAAASPAVLDAWYAVIRAAAYPQGGLEWLAEPSAFVPRLSIPAEPLPTSNRPAVAVCARDRESFAVHGRIGRDAEFCVIARSPVDHAAGTIDGYWCRLSAQEAAWKQWSNT